jgi:hypothetical protein
VTHPQLAQERSASRRGEGSREVALRPACPRALDVGTAAPAVDQVEVEERRAPHVEHVGFLLDDPGPRAQLGQQVGEVVEFRWRAMRHLSILAGRRRVRPGRSLQGARHV